MKDTDKFLFDLNKPIPGMAVTQNDVEREMEDFAAFAAAMGVQPPKPAEVPADA